MNDERFQELERRFRALEASDKIPRQRRPRILVCGCTGSGKTSTINTLLGRDVGAVGHYARGTERAAVYELESNNENLLVVDLPGLGDSRRYNRKFVKLHKRHARQSDGFIVVISPPRPAQAATMDAVQVLLDSGVPAARIIFGYNKLSELQYQQPNDAVAKVEVDGLIGPRSDLHLGVIDSAKQAFFKDLTSEFGNHSFSFNQIIEYDSHTGWNLHSLLLRVVETLPYETVGKVRIATKYASSKVRQRESDRLEMGRQTIAAKWQMIQELEQRVKQHELKLRELLKDTNQSGKFGHFDRSIHSPDGHAKADEATAKAEEATAKADAVTTKAVQQLDALAKATTETKKELDNLREQKAQLAEEIRAQEAIVKERMEALKNYELIEEKADATILGKLVEKVGGYLDVGLRTMATSPQVIADLGKRILSWLY